MKERRCGAGKDCESFVGRNSGAWACAYSGTFGLHLDLTSPIRRSNLMLGVDRQLHSFNPHKAIHVVI